MLLLEWEIVHSQGRGLSLNCFFFWKWEDLKTQCQQGIGSPACFSNRNCHFSLGIFCGCSHQEIVTGHSCVSLTPPRPRSSVAFKMISHCQHDKKRLNTKLTVVVIKIKSTVKVPRNLHSSLVWGTNFQSVKTLKYLFRTDKARVFASPCTQSDSLQVFLHRLFQWSQELWKSCPFFGFSPTRPAKSPHQFWLVQLGGQAWLEKYFSVKS